MPLIASVFLSAVLSHSSLISPMPRNAVDRTLAPWNDPQWGPGTLPHNASCKHPSYENSTTQKPGECWGCTCVNGTAPCLVAQTCAYFNQVGEEAEAGTAKTMGRRLAYHLRE